MKKSIFALLTTVTMIVAAGLGFLGCEKQGLSTPTGFKAVQEDDEIILTWNEVTGASFYEVTKNGSYWQSTSDTRLVDSKPEEGINSYELTASDGEKQSKPAKTSCNYEAPASGGGEDNPQTGTSYYIKHPWNGGEWTWHKMKQDESTYTYVGTWGGVGANINTSADDSGSEWYEASTIKGSSNVNMGEKVIFTFYPFNGAKGDLIVQAYSEGGGDNPGGGGSETQTLPAPTNFTLSQTSSCVNLSWSKVSGASSYYVCRALPEDDQYSVIKETTSTSYADYDVSAGTTYYYAVAAVDANGEYGDLAEKSITFNGSSSGGGGGGTTSKPNTPTNVKATAGTSSITVTWSSVSGADGYKVYRSTSASGSFSPLTNVTNTTYTDYNVNTGTSYYYKVSAVNNAGESSMSSYAYAKIASSGGGDNPGGGGSSTNYEPCPPSVTCSGSSSVTVKWTAATSTGCGKPTSYDVLRKNLITGQTETLKSGTTSTSYTDSKPFPGINTYGVRAINSYGKATGQNVSSSIGIEAPTFAGENITASANYVFVTVKDLNVPEEWKKYYTLQLYKSSSYSGYYAIEHSWKYEECSGINNQLSFNKYYGSSVNLTGYTYYFKVRWVFEAPYSSIVEGSYSSVKKVTHQ